MVVLLKNYLLILLKWKGLLANCLQTLSSNAKIHGICQYKICVVSAVMVLVTWLVPEQAVVPLLKQAVPMAVYHTMQSPKKVKCLETPHIKHSILPHILVEWDDPFAVIGRGWHYDVDEEAACQCSTQMRGINNAIFTRKFQPKHAQGCITAQPVRKAPYLQDAWFRMV